MGSDNQHDGIDPYAAGLIRFKARQLVGKAGFTASDREDLEQEMILDLLRRLPKYDPKRAPAQHVSSPGWSSTGSPPSSKRKKAGIRDYRRCRCSLNDCFEDEDGRLVERAETFDQEDYLLRTGTQSRSSEELNRLTIDVVAILEGLPHELRNLCRRLKAETVTEISRDTGVSARHDLRVDQEAPGDLRGRRPQGLPVSVPTVPVCLR